MHGVGALVRLPFYPFVLLVTNFLRLITTLASCQKFANGKLSQFSNFRPWYAVNGLYYWTMALNLDRYGRTGSSPYLGLSNYKLSHWWHISLPSIYLYWRFGALLPIVSMLSWLVTQSLWLTLPTTDLSVFIISIFLSSFSSYFYGAAFCFSNYNIVGWLFLPTLLFSLFTHSNLLAIVSLVLISFGSITACFLGSLLALAISLITGDYLISLVVIPSALKFLTHFFYSDDPFQVFNTILSQIGMYTYSKKPPIFKRLSQWKRLFAPDSLFFISTWSIFSMLVFTSDTPYLLESKVAVIFMLFIWILNATFLRFADQISLYMLAFTLSTGILIASSFQIILFISYWLVVSPLPYLISAGPPSNPDCPIAYKPFNINRLIQACSEFISDIPSESKVILSLKDPNGDYAKIYDGYRVNFELLFYTANIKNILVLPDWWAIFKLNDMPSESVWSSSPSDASKVAKRFDADYVLVTQRSNSNLDASWHKSGFSLVSTFDWGSTGHTILSTDPVWEPVFPAPKWFLLKLDSSF